MSSVNMTWEDDEYSRQVRFRVDYTVGNSGVEILDIVPTEVAFDDKENIRVHTDKGRSMLKSQLVTSGRLETLEAEITEKEGLLNSV